MTYTKEEIERVRNISIAAQLGIPMTRSKVSIRCPHPDHRDSSPSFLLDEDNGFKCFGKCGAHGRGFIDFCVFMGNSFEDVMKEYK